jgi:hypothetical protein
MPQDAVHNRLTAPSDLFLVRLDRPSRRTSPLRSAVSLLKSVELTHNDLAIEQLVRCCIDRSYGDTLRS